MMDFLRANRSLLFSVLGFLSLFMLLFATAPYWLRFLNQKLIKTKDKRYLNLIKFCRRFHKPVGILLLPIALLHGYLALFFRIRGHTGSLVYLSMLITIVLGGTYYKTKNKKVFKVHKAMALTTFLLFLLHFLYPAALAVWFGIY